MSARNYQFDPLMELEENHIKNETHVVYNLGIMPKAQAFFKKGLVVEGYRNSTWVKLEPGQDFAFSPLYVEISGAVGEQAYSYIYLLSSVDMYSRIRLGYHAVGEYKDDDLYAHLADLEFDRNTVSGWRSVKNIFNAPLRTRLPELENKSTMEVLSTFMAKVNETLEEALVKGGSSHLEARLQKLESDFDQFLNATPE